MIVAATQMRHVRASASRRARPVTRRGSGAPVISGLPSSSSIRHVGPVTAGLLPLVAGRRGPPAGALAPVPPPHRIGW